MTWHYSALNCRNPAESSLRAPLAARTMRSAGKPLGEWRSCASGAAGAFTERTGTFSVPAQAFEPRPRGSTLLEVAARRAHARATPVMPSIQRSSEVFTAVSSGAQPSIGQEGRKP